MKKWYENVLPMDWETEDFPQAGEDFVNYLWISVGAKFCGDDSLVDFCHEGIKTGQLRVI